MELRDVMEKYPNLTFQGFRQGESIEMSDRLALSIQWLQENFKPNKKAGHGPWAQSFKRFFEDDTKSYVSRGEMLAAALMAGFPISKNEHIGVSSKSMLDYDLRKIKHLSLPMRTSVGPLMKWNIKLHYKWGKMKADNSITDEFVENLKVTFPDREFDISSIKKASGWLRTFSFSDSGEPRTARKVALEMEWCTNFYPNEDNIIAAIIWLKIPHENFSIRFDSKSEKRILNAYNRLRFI